MVVANFLYEYKGVFEIPQRLDYRGCLLTLKPNPERFC